MCQSKFVTSKFHLITLDLVSIYKLDVVALTIIGKSQEYWWVAYYHQEVILFIAILCAHVCGTSQNAF